MGESWQHGKNIFLLLLLSVLLRTTEAAPEREMQYVAVVPSRIYLETPENFCIQINNLNETVSLTLSLEYNIQHLILNKMTIEGKDVFQCVPFQISRSSNILPSSEVILSLRAQGLTQHFWSRKKVWIEKPKHLVFIQTDKPIYRAGQKVQFRIVSMDKDFRPMKNKFPVVYIQDPKNNQVFQWRDVEIPLGIIQLSYSLSSDPLLGTYKVVVEEDSTKVVENSFDVDDYVLPKFEVLINAPKLITVMTRKVTIRVCGWYTYGKPVPGMVQMRICRMNYIDAMLCKEFEDEADGDGCFSKVVNMEPFHLRSYEYLMEITVEGKITEEGTGVELNAAESIEITSTLSKIIFEDVDLYYKPGMPYVVKVKLVDSNEVPINNGKVEILMTATGQQLHQVTDAEGRAEFSIESTSFRGTDLSFTATHEDESSQALKQWIIPSHGRASHTPYKFYSPSKSYLYIEPASEILSCGHREPVRVRYILNRDGETDDEIVFYYMVKARDNIIRTGTHRQPVEQGEEIKGDFLLNLLVDVDTSPKIHLLLYTILPSGELVVGSRNFTVEKCFSNKAKLWFSERGGLPGQKTQLHLSANPGSLCAIHAVDQSVFLLKPEAELSPEKVYNFIPKKDYIFLTDRLRDIFTFYPCPTEEPSRGKRIGGLGHFLPENGDIYNTFWDFGVNIFTNTRLRISSFCPFVEDGSIHWERTWKPRQRSDFPHSTRAPSFEVEMTSYVLLALLKKEPYPSEEELTSSAAIVKWLTKQQNSRGGFASSQDTVVALQALSQYKTLTYSKDGIDARATLSSGDAVLREFHVDRHNSLLLQCQDLPQVPGNYKAEVTGCIFMKIPLKYNVPLKQEEAPFRLEVHTIPETCTGVKAHVTFDIAINVSYTGQRPVSNMAIVQIKMLSGYIPVKSSVKKLETESQIERTEVNINHVLLYLDEVPRTVQTFSFTVEQETPVRDLKPALVKVYDYYETDEFATAEYTAPCSTDDTKEVKA